MLPARNIMIINKTFLCKNNLWIQCIVCRVKPCALALLMGTNWRYYSAIPGNTITFTSLHKRSDLGRKQGDFYCSIMEPTGKAK